MEDYDFKKSLQTAIDKNPKEVIFINLPSFNYANIQFYSYLIDNPKKIPIRLSEKGDASLNSCFLYNQGNEKILVNNNHYSFTDYENSKELNWVEKNLNIPSTKALIKVRCYKNLQD